MSEADHVVEVQTTAARGDCNRYEYDSQMQAMRFAEVLRVADWLPADRGVVTDSLAGGGPLPVWLVTRQPIFPGCRVAARVIGAIAVDGSSQFTVVAVPLADEAEAATVDWGQLPLGQRRQLEAASLPDGQDAREVRWLHADEVARPLHEARQAFRLARSGDGKTGPSLPAWATTLGRSQRRELGVETDVHSEAEYSLYMLPYRFQRYVAEFLLPDERILLLAARPPIAHGGWWLWCRQRAHEGVLLLTDRQVILMQDVAPPDGTLVPWGYEVCGVALERLSGIELQERRGHARLALTVEASGGVEHLNWPLPPEALAAWQQAAEILKAFLPRGDDRRLLRLPIPVSVPETPPQFVDAHEEAKARRLREALAGHAEREGGLLASAFTAGYEDRRVGAKIVGLTPQRLLVLAERAQGRVTSYRLAAIASVTLRHSLLYSELRLTLPGRGAAALSFDFAAGRQFLAVFAALRRVQGVPPTCEVTPVLHAAREAVA